MRRNRFFNSAGEKRKFYNNLRHFGQTRNMGIAVLGLMPLLGAIGLLVMFAIAVTHCNWGQTSVISKVHSRNFSQIVSSVLGASAFAVNGRDLFKQRQSLQQKKADLNKAMTAMLDQADKEGRVLSAAEEAQWEGFLAQSKEISAKLDSMWPGETMAGDSGRGAGKKQPVKPENNPGGYQVEVLPPKKFNSLAEQLVAVAMFEKSRGFSRDPRLLALGSQEHKSIQAAAGLNEGVPAEGGFLVQTDFVSDLWERVYESGQLLNYVRRIQVSSSANRMKMNALDEQSRANGSRFGGVQSFWGNEAQTVTASKPKFRQVEWELNKLIALCYATDEMIADASMLNSVLNTAFPMEFAFRMEDGIVNGPGNGQPAGFMNSPALIVVSKESGQAANTVVAANIMKMWSRCWGPSRRNAIWLIDQSIEPQLYQMTITTGTGISTPIYLPPGGISGNPYGTLFGRPVIPVEYGAALSSQGDIILADLSQYVLAEKGAVQMASSMHVNFTTDEMAFRFTTRVDGQSLWNVPLTPKSNSGTLSPFVTLQAR